jgi:tripartite-type tricarboxylate transporter receptor subunit TctC
MACRRSAVLRFAAASGYHQAGIYAGRIVVSLAAGTGMDALTRIYAEKLSPALGKPVIVENKAGAATTLAANQVATAPADGHTSQTLSIEPQLSKGGGGAFICAVNGTWPKFFRNQTAARMFFEVTGGSFL